MRRESLACSSIQRAALLISLVSPIHKQRLLAPTPPMITIKPSTDTDNPSPPEDNAEELKKRIPLVWIPATLVVGLLIAAVYLGGRIVKARPSAKPEVVQLAKPVTVTPPVQPAQASSTNESPATTESPAANVSPATTEATADSTKPVRSEPLTVVTPDDGIPVITPHTGQRYIQVGALDQEATRRFVQRLRSEKWIHMWPKDRRPS